MVRSMIAPKRPTAIGASTSAHQYPSPALLSRNQATKAPIMYWAPCVKLLTFERQRVVDLATVLAHAALAEERIVGRQLLHLGDHLRTVVGLRRFHRLEVVQHRRVHAGVDHRRHVALVLRREALGEGARAVVL